MTDAQFQDIRDRLIRIETELKPMAAQITDHETRLRAIDKTATENATRIDSLEAARPNGRGGYVLLTAGAGGSGSVLGILAKSAWDYFTNHHR